MQEVATQPFAWPEVRSEPAGLFAEFPSLLVDPATGGSIVQRDGGFAVAGSDHQLPMTDGIPNLFVANNAPFAGDVTEMVKAFYEETPFPNYDDLDSRGSLAAKARRSFFAARLDEQLPDGALVLEAGCGTGQLSNFLGMSWRRKVFAGDICLNSLRLAKGFADHYDIRNVAFLQMNLFRPPFRDGTFDVVISNGVLHHTGNCEAGFKAILAKLKPGGHIIVGLYNKLGRLPTLWKRSAFQAFGSKLHFLDPRLREGSRDPDRIQAWFMDQYRHPHETRHSMDEVLSWFKRHGVDFVNGIPHLDGSDFVEGEKLFATHAPGSMASRFMTQFGMLASGGRDGGLFIMMGRKRVR